jgi:two-component system, sensor histidine kinase YesM
LLVLRIGGPAIEGMLENVSGIAGLRAGVLSCGSVVATVGTDIEGFDDLRKRLLDEDAVPGATRALAGYLWFSNPIENICGELSVFIPQRALSMNTTRYRVWLVVMTCVAVASFVAFVFIVDAAVRKPLARLMGAFAELEHDNLLSLDHDIEDDFAFVYAAFNGMTARLRGAIEEVYLSTIARQQAELRHLQSQINPHFLYNSFCHVRRMAKMGDLDGVDEMSRKLSEYYRYITKTNSELIPLGQEVRHARAYIDIQRIRFGDRVVATIEDVPGEWVQRPVPKLILQPLIENAYVHGLEDREEGGRIRVRFEERGELLLVCIEDDGYPHSDDYIAKIRQATEPDGPQNSSTGILNVRRRLQLSGAGDMTIDRSEPGGLLVRIVIKKDDVGCTKSSS